MPRKTTTKIRFKTLTAVTKLLHSFNLNREFYRVIKEEGGAYQPAQVTRVFKAHSDLRNLSFELKQWSRKHRKTYGKPAIVDDFLDLHADRTAELLKALETTVDALDRDYYKDSMRRIFIEARVALARMWALTMEPVEVTAERVAAVMIAPESQPHNMLDLLASLLGKRASDTNKPKEKKEPEAKPTIPFTTDDGARLADDVDAWLRGEG